MTSGDGVEGTRVTVEQDGTMIFHAKEGPSLFAARCVCGHTFAAHPAGVCAPIYCECKGFERAEPGG